MEMITTDLVSLADGYDVLRGVENIKIGNNQYSNYSIKTLRFSDLPHLKFVKIGELSFQYVDKLDIFGCSKLELLEIGNGSFVVNTTNTEYACDNGTVTIYDCMKLQSIKFDSFAFRDFSQFDLHGILVFIP